MDNGNTASNYEFLIPTIRNIFDDPRRNLIVLKVDPLLGSKVFINVLDMQILAE